MMRSAAIEARPAGVEDADALATLHAACFGSPWDAALLRIFLGAPDCLCLLYAEGDVARGFLLIRLAADEAEILTIAVSPTVRRRGVARALLEAAIGALRSRGAKQLYLEVDEKNAAAFALYRGLGAEPVGHRASYYADGGDAAILRLTLQEYLAEEEPSR